MDLFRKCSLIIWDEVPMQHQHCLEVVNHMLRDICNSDKPFGGLTIVFGGDFCKNKLVIIKGSRG